MVLIGSPSEGSVLSLMSTHRHFGCWLRTFSVSSQHCGVGFGAMPLTYGMHEARFCNWSAHSFSSSSMVATVDTNVARNNIKNNLTLAMS